MEISTTATTPYEVYLELEISRLRNRIRTLEDERPMAPIMQTNSGDVLEITEDYKPIKMIPLADACQYRSDMMGWNVRVRSYRKFDMGVPDITHFISERSFDHVPKNQVMNIMGTLHEKVIKKLGHMIMDEYR